MVREENIESKFWLYLTKHYKDNVKEKWKEYRQVQKFKDLQVKKTDYF